jgi:prepilin-type N-terminal cleavage/methylation domain-containing protein
MRITRILPMAADKMRAGAERGFTRTPTLPSGLSRTESARTKLVCGFTLIEMMVSLSVFSVVILLSMGAIVSILDANQKSQTLRSVMDNMNVTLESMSRKVRFGTTYHCGTSIPTNTPADCSSGDSTLTITASDRTLVTYKLSGSRIARSVNGAANSYLTSPDVTIQALTFYVTGSPAYNGGANTLQPRVIVVIKGYAGAKNTTKSSFMLQTTISQRKLDS